MCTKTHMRPEINTTTRKGWRSQHSKRGIHRPIFQAKENVNEIKGEFGDEVTVHLLKRNIKSDNSDLEINIKKIDNHIDIDYTREQLEEKLQNHV